jgi:hypothetical protein
MKFNEKNIYELLPAVYRLRDAELNYPLKALIEIIAQQAGTIQDNISQLYDNWFIETCEEWVVPYIGDLLGVRNFHAVSGAAVSQRAYIANTLSYRRRKGIAPVLEQLTLDTTGWRAHVTEFFQLLQTTQYMNHIRLQRTITPDLRQMNQLDLLNTPFDTLAHAADVRHIATNRGKYNIPNIGLFVWRLQNYPVVRSDAFRTLCISSPSTSPVAATNFVFTFSPLGVNTQLFNNPATESSITHISAETNVPGLLRRRALYEELESRREALETGDPIIYSYFNDQPEIEDDLATARHPVFEIFPEGDQVAIKPEEILICNLEQCCNVATDISFKELKHDGSFLTREIKALVDPVAGRFMFANPAVTSVLVSYSYGHSGDIGGGPYNRRASIPDIFHKKLTSEETASVSWQAGVSKSETGTGLFNTIQKALDEWNSLPAGQTGIISIMDSRSYIEDLTVIIKEKSRLLIIAADWPKRDVENGTAGEKQRIRGDITADKLRPHIRGHINISGIENNTSQPEQSGGEITLNGLLIEGKATVLKGNLGSFNLVHSTLVPGKGGFEAEAGIAGNEPNEWLSIRLSQSICASVNLNGTSVITLLAEDCIIDEDTITGKSISAASTPLMLKKTTVFGATDCKTIEADSCIFNAIVTAARRQTGCVRFSFVPPDSETPRKYRCQPELEINTQIEEQSKTQVLSNAAKATIRDKVNNWLLPAFTSVEYNQYAYGQLSVNCPAQISTGADNGSEMGAFNFLQQPQRLANLHIALNEYLPLGLEAGTFYTT